MITILGRKVKTGKKMTAPKNEAVLSYLHAAEKGEGKARKILKSV